MTFDIIPAQSVILTACGYANPALIKTTWLASKSKLSKAITAIQLAALITYLLALTAMDAWIFSDLINRLSGFNQLYNAEDPLIIRVVTWVWNATIAIRPLVILIIFATKRPHWKHLHRTVNMFAAVVYPDRKIARKVGRFSLVLLLVTFVAHVGYSTISWSDANGAFPPHEHRYNFCYFEICFTLKEIVPIWIISTDLPFILSQQVLVIGLAIAVTLLKGLQGVSYDIRAETTKWLKEKSNDGKQEELLCEKICKWTFVYVKGQIVLRQLNEFFGWILLVSVGFDFVTALGVSGYVMTSERPLSRLSTTLNAGIAVLFLAYATVFFVPFVMLLEKSKEVDVLLRHLTWTVKRWTIHPGDSLENCSKHSDLSLKSRQISSKLRLEHSLNELSELVQQNAFAVEAGGLFVFTRSYLVTVVSSIATLLLIAQEMMDRSVKATAAVPTSNNTFAGTFYSNYSL
ncbi:hypothetical protein BV898_16394 [Hypsibius exemplaris]|uniref:Gustatory receptor n=1 Tax=Hypsibius exemplaris TaxID=2072580 RepID=A0A9X6RL79_HYPEX|nr:hypothetical protein BV898_16394 [Hypsibius exemplaris]